MQKKLTILILIMFNLNFYTQVVIKDEINLDAEKFEMQLTESAGLTMPFYGRVYSQIPCQWNHWISGAVKITRIADGQTDLSGCQTFNCGGGGWCACSGGTRAINFYNVPQGAEILVEIQRCYNPPPNPPNDPSWQEVPLNFTNVGNNRFDLYGQDLSDQSWDYIGYFRFYPTTPPACCPLTDGPCAPLCEQPFDPPDTNIYRIPDASRCNEPVKDIPAGVFTPHYWGLGDGEEVIATPCQDPMTGNIKFKFATNQRTSIDLPYNLELCPDRIAYLNLTRIDSEEEFEDYLTHNVSNTNDACTLRQLILNHKGLDSQENQTGGEILSQNGIWITASTLAHEYEHERDYEKALREKINIFYKYYDNYSIECSTYVQNTENAKTIAGNDFRAQLFEFSTAARNYYESNLDEVELNGRPGVQNAIEPYLTMLDTFIRVRFGYKILEEIKRFCK